MIPVRHIEHVYEYRYFKNKENFDFMESLFWIPMMYVLLYYCSIQL